MWENIKKIAGSSSEKPESNGINDSSPNEIYCSKCRNLVMGKTNIVCKTCFNSNIERILVQARVARKKLEERIEETATQNQAFRREVQARQTKQLEKIAELEDRLLIEQAHQGAVLSKLYYLVSRAYFEPFGIMSLYYIADRRNLASIFAKGILCKNRVEEEGISHSSFAAQDIQALRSQIRVGPNYAHDYVPLYFEPKPPMLYRLQKEYQKCSNQNALIYICVRREILTEQGVFFTDRNLAAANCKFYQSIEDLALLKWDIIQTKTWGGDEEKKHIKGAEVLVPNCVSPNWFTKIVVYDETAREEVRSSQQTKLPIEVNRNEFYY